MSYPGQPPGDGDGNARLKAVSGTCFCLLYDLCGWLAGTAWPVPPETEEYTRAELRGIADPRERLSRYSSPSLLSSWQRALEPFFQAGVSLLPELDEEGSLRYEGLQEKGPVLAQLDFVSHSALLAADGRRLSLPRRRWVLSVWLSADLGRVESASIRPV